MKANPSQVGKRGSSSPAKPQTTKSAVQPPMKDPTWGSLPGAHPTITETPINKVFFGFEDSQKLARGLLIPLSDAYASMATDEYAAVGLSEAAHEIVNKVRLAWDELNAQWDGQRATDSARLDYLETMPAALRSAFEDMLPPLRDAAACVHALALALKNRAEIEGNLRSTNAVQLGYSELAENWADEILRAVDMFRSPKTYNLARNTAAASTEPKAAA